MKNLKNIHKEFVRIGKTRHKLKNQLLMLLPKIYKSGIYKKYASSIFEYAAKFGDLSKYAVETRLRLDPNLIGKPHLRAAIVKAGVKKVAMVAKLATEKTEEIFANKITNMSKSAVQTLSKELRQAKNLGWTTEVSRDMVVKCEAKPQNIKLELDDEMIFQFLKLKKEYGEGLSNKEVMRKILEVASKTLPGQTPQGLSVKTSRKNNSKETKKLKTANLKISKKTAGKPKSYINVHLKNRVTERSRGKCEYNGCNNPAEHFHHTKRFSEIHSHEGIVHVCKDHHQIIHNGFIINEQGAPETWQLILDRPLGYADDCYMKCREEVLT